MKASNAGAAAENAAREHSERFAAGLKQFNSRLFFDAHETWEEIWLASAEPDKTFLQGIIQIAAAFHHYGRGNMRGTQSLLEAGLRRLGRFEHGHYGIDVESLRAATREWTAPLAAGDEPGPARGPPIRKKQ